jgi:hypothetical protein
MDIVTPTLIAALSRLSESVIKDAYEKLKNALMRKPDQSVGLVKAIELLEEKPESEGRREVLREEIETSKAYLDDEVNQAAKALGEQLRLQTNIQHNVQQKVTGDHNMFSGTGDVTVNKDS